MTIEHALEQIRAHSGTCVCPPAGVSAVREIEGFSPPLPLPHQRLLTLANGMSVYHGHVSVFGLGCQQCVDLAKWNDVATWKFAWPTLDLGRWLCFGQTSWGEQFAYDLRELQANSKPKIYQLNHATLTPGLWAEDFEEFVERTLLGMARVPYMLTETYEKFGTVHWSESITHVPSLFLGGVIGDAEHMMRMDSVAQMIIDGDIFTQCTGENSRRPVSSVTPYQDERGRSRMRVNFQEGEVATPNGVQ